MAEGPRERLGWLFGTADLTLARQSLGLELELDPVLLFVCAWPLLGRSSNRDHRRMTPTFDVR